MLPGFGLLMPGIASGPFPVVAATNHGNAGAGATSLTVPLPSGIVAGNLLLVFVSWVSSSTTLTTPTGWTAAYKDNIAGFSKNSALFYKIASGSEGASVSIAASASSLMNAISLRITGSDTAVAPAFGARATGAAAAITAPALSPSWGSANTLWIVFSGSSLSSGGTVSSYPTGFTDNHVLENGGTGISTIATHNDTVATETPGALTWGATPTGDMAVLVGIKPL